MNLFPVSIGQNIIKRKESTQFLGIVIDESLCWKKHINHISLKLSRGIGILSRLKYYLPSNILMMFNIQHNTCSAFQLPQHYLG